MPIIYTNLLPQTAEGPLVALSVSHYHMDYLTIRVDVLGTVAEIVLAKNEAIEFLELPRQVASRLGYCRITYQPTGGKHCLLSFSATDEETGEYRRVDAPR